MRVADAHIHRRAPPVHYASLELPQKFRLIRVLFAKMRAQSTLTFMNRNHHFLLFQERVANTLFYYWHLQLTNRRISAQNLHFSEHENQSQ
jgi:hypothetical protein